jgi:hypothetical protein
MGSQAFIAVARVGHLCVEEIEQNEYGQRQPTGRFLFTNPKNNPQEKKPTLAYRIASAIGGTDSITGVDIQTSEIVWEEVVSVTADEAIAANSAKKDAYGARVFLMDVLSNGPVPVRTIEERAEAHGLSKDQLKTRQAENGHRGFQRESRGWPLVLGTAAAHGRVRPKGVIFRRVREGGLSQYSPPSPSSSGSAAIVEKGGAFLT